MNIKSFYHLAIISLVSSLFLSNSDGHTDIDAENLNVFIIGVNQFDHEKWQNPRLERNIAKVSKNLSKFFSEERFNAKVHTLTSADSTKSEFIEEYLFKEFKKINDHSLVMFFFISHGIKSVEDGNENFYLITSDTSDKPNVRNAFSIENDFLPITSRLRKSLLMSFIDACNSEYGIGLTSRIKNSIRTSSLGVEQFMIGASLKDKKSYNAFFTKSLLKMWKDDENLNECSTKIYDGQIRNSLRPYYESILKEENLSHLVDKFRPKVLIDYRSERICLETFKRKSGFILFSNYSDETIICEVYNQRDKKFVIEFDVNPGNFIPFHSDLNKDYLIVIKDKDGALKDSISKSIKKGLAIETHYYPSSDKAKLASLYIEAATLGENLDLDKQSILNNYRAYVAAINVNNKVKKNQFIPEYISPRLAKSSTSNLNWVQAREDFDRGDFVAYFGTTRSTPVMLAKDMFMNGDYKTASKLYFYAAENESDTIQNRKLIEYSLNNIQLAILSEKIDTTKIKSATWYIDLASEASFNPIAKDSINKALKTISEAKKLSAELIDKHIKEVILKDKN